MVETPDKQENPLEIASHIINRVVAEKVMGWIPPRLNLPQGTWIHVPHDPILRHKETGQEASFEEYHESYYWSHPTHACKYIPIPLNYVDNCDLDLEVLEYVRDNWEIGHVSAFWKYVFDFGKSRKPKEHIYFSSRMWYQCGDYATAAYMVVNKKFHPKLEENYRKRYGTKSRSAK